jgi:hypothetical protein
MPTRKIKCCPLCARRYFGKLKECQNHNRILPVCKASACKEPTQKEKLQRKLREKKMFDKHVKNDKNFVAKQTKRLAQYAAAKETRKRKKFFFFGGRG